MSEYQFYDFYAIDRPLSEEERRAVDDLSSRSTPTSRRATFEYSYSDFRHDPKDVLRRYFDMMVYMANWGTYQLMLKLLKKMEPYLKSQAFVSRLKEQKINW